MDLSSGKVEVKEIPRKLKEPFLGGRGIDMYLLYNLLKSGIDPLGPEIEIADPEQALGYHKELFDFIQSSKCAQIMGRWGTIFMYDLTNSTGLVRTRNFQAKQLPDSDERPTPSRALGIATATREAHWGSRSPWLSGAEGGLALGSSGGIRVDEYMRTSLRGVWACGDCWVTVCA